MVSIHRVSISGNVRAIETRLFVFVFFVPSRVIGMDGSGTDNPKRDVVILIDGTQQSDRAKQEEVKGLRARLTRNDVLLTSKYRAKISANCSYEISALKKEHPYQ